MIRHYRPGAILPAALVIEWRSVDLHDTEGFAAHATGASVVVHALSPSAYTNTAWKADVATDRSFTVWGGAVKTWTG